MPIGTAINKSDRRRRQRVDDERKGPEGAGPRRPRRPGDEMDAELVESRPRGVQHAPHEEQDDGPEEESYAP